MEEKRIYSQGNYVGTNWTYGIRLPWAHSNAGIQVLLDKAQELNVKVRGLDFGIPMRGKYDETWIRAWMQTSPPKSDDDIIWPEDKI
jgi:hypothetical protein